jgi:anti-sigma factor RsiW
MNGEHERYRDDVGAYLLSALDTAELAEFERHLAGCPECRAEIEELRVAADALPRSVEPFAAPPSLKRSLMAAVKEDAQPARQPLLARLGLDRLFRPQLALAGAAVVIAVAVAVGTQLGGGGHHGGRVVTAAVDRSRLPDATATVTLNHGSGQLRVTGMPRPRPGQVYEIWLKRGNQVQPGPLFNTDRGGNGAGAIPNDLQGVDAILVTREKTGGAMTPSEAPVISAPI